MLVVAMKRPALILVSLAGFVIILWALFSNGVVTGQYNGSTISSLFDGQAPNSYNKIRSVSTVNEEYFMIDFGNQETMNPNIIPHPVLSDTWIVTAQLRQFTELFAEISCNAMFENDTLRCVTHASALPIAPTFGDKCTGDLDFLNLNKGPHDARVFYGPHTPYIIYGSNSMFICFGQWIQDFRSLVEWGFENFENDFLLATELQRPPPWGTMEKNWFLFFDHKDQAYIHYDVAPKRSFAKLESDGSVGNDLGLLTAAHDEQCAMKYMPKLGPELESIHQATNSLLITMCKRNDASCIPDDTNTFIFTVFQHKTYFDFHAVYEPYLYVFEQAAPFKLHGMSRTPFWINGRTERGQEQRAESSGDYSVKGGIEAPKQEMFYITSISWKMSGQRYHGYVDDVLFVAFGIEDERSAAIDVVADDLLRDLGTC